MTEMNLLFGFIGFTVATIAVLLVMRTAFIK